MGKVYIVWDSENDIEIAAYFDKWAAIRKAELHPVYALVIDSNGGNFKIIHERTGAERGRI